MSSTPYLCEAEGARILKAGVGISQVGTEYQVQLETWDDVPAGPVGDVLFRSIDVVGKMTNGYSIGITPYIDGVAQVEQLFSGFGTGEFQAQAFFAVRGTRCAAKVRTLTRAGELEFHDISNAHVIVRSTP